MAMFQLADREVRRRSLLKGVPVALLGLLGHPFSALAQESEKTLRKIAFGSCAFQWEQQTIWSAINTRQPDLFLFLGDAIYGDWHGDKPFTPSETGLREDWQKLANQQGFAELRKTTPVMATWDNHDYGSHDGGAEFALKEMTKRLFLDFLGEPADSKRRQRPGVYNARVFGEAGRRVQIVLLDTKTFRSGFKKDERTAEELKAAGKVGKYAANNDPDATVLGDEQWAWLEQQLQKPAELRLVCSSTQVIPDQKGMDEWGVFPGEREKLLRLIRNGKNVVLLSGNVHFTELSKIRNGNADLFELTSSGMTHFTQRYAKAENKYRAAGGIAVENFGSVEIDWQNKKVRLAAYDINGSELYAVAVQV